MKTIDRYTRDKRSSAADPVSEIAKLAPQLLGSGKLTMALAEVVHATNFSRRTIRRFELKGHLVALKGTRTKVYLVSDVLAMLERIR